PRGQVGPILYFAVCASLGDVGDGRLVDIEGLSQGGEAFSPAAAKSDGQHLPKTEFPSAGAPVWAGAMLIHVANIARRRVIPEVFQAVVVPNAMVVADDHARRARPNRVLENKPMDPAPLPGPIQIHHADVGIAGFDLPLLQVALAAPDTPHARDFVAL